MCGVYHQIRVHLVLFSCVCASTIFRKSLPFRLAPRRLHRHTHTHVLRRKFSLVFSCASRGQTPYGWTLAIDSWPVMWLLRICLYACMPCACQHCVHTRIVRVRPRIMNNKNTKRQNRINLSSVSYMREIHWSEGHHSACGRKIGLFCIRFYLLS